MFHWVYEHPLSEGFRNRLMRGASGAPWIRAPSPTFPFIEADRKSSTHCQSDAIDPERTLGSILTALRFSCSLSREVIVNEIHSFPEVSVEEQRDFLKRILCLRRGIVSVVLGMRLRLEDLKLRLDAFCA
jgi:hypothetical protein